MKIDTMRLITDKINDIELAKKLIRGLENFKDNEIKLLLDELEKCEYNELACNLAIDQTVLANKTIEDRVKLIQALKDCENAYNIAIDKNVHANRTIDECITLMQVYKEYDYVWDVFLIITDKNVLETRTTKKQIKLIKFLKKCEYNEYVYRIIVNKNVLNSKTNAEQITLMKAFKECDYNNFVYELIIDPNLLKLDTQEHLKLIQIFKDCGYDDYIFCEIKSRCITEEMENKYKKVTFDKGLDDIKTLDEMKEYINQLKANKLEDINSKTLVYKYKK